MLGGVNEDRRAVGARAVGPVGAPLLVAAVLVQGDDVGLGVLVAVEDDEVFIKDRRSAKSVRGQQLARRLPPDFVAVEIVTDRHHVGVVEEGDVDVFAVGGRRRAGEAVEAVLVLEARLHDGPVPKDAAVGPVEAEQFAVAFLLVFIDAGGDEEAVAPDDRRRVADAGDGRLPADVLLRPPRFGEAGFGGSAVAARPAPAGPLLGPHRRGAETECDDQDPHACGHAIPLRMSCGASAAGRRPGAADVRAVSSDGTPSATAGQWVRRRVSSFPGGQHLARVSARREFERGSRSWFTSSGGPPLGEVKYGTRTPAFVRPPAPEGAKDFHRKYERIGCGRGRRSRFVGWRGPGRTWAWAKPLINAVRIRHG